MKFESETAAYEFYNDYSKRIGFGIRREYGNKGRIDGVLTSRRFTYFKARLSKSGLYFKSKGSSKIGIRKIAIKIEGFYSKTFVESL
jgi:hypothetical protein